MSTLIDEIDRFSERTGLAPSTIALYALGNSHLPDRLRQGGSCTLKTAEKLRKWMAENADRRAPSGTTESTEAA